MTDPDNWHRRAGARRDGPAVVFDLDGVISDATHRQSYLRREPKDWRGFFLASVDDPVIDSGRALTRSVDAGHTLIILTARPAYTAAGTLEWLRRHDVRHDLLVLRPDHDLQPSPQYKRGELAALRSAGYEIRLAIDDDDQIVAMYRQEGVFALYVHSGYYEYRQTHPSP